MKKNFILLGLAFTMLATSCSKNDNSDEPEIVIPGEGTGTSVEVSGDIKVNTTWTADKIYQLKGYVYVTDGATLTIEPLVITKVAFVALSPLMIVPGSIVKVTGEV